MAMTGKDCVVPVIVETGRPEVDIGDGLLVHLDASRIGVPIEHGSDLEAGGSASTGDQLDDHLVTDDLPRRRTRISEPVGVSSVQATTVEVGVAATAG